MAYNPDPPGLAWPVRLLARATALRLALVFVIAAALVTFFEIDRLIAGSIGDDGISHPMSSIIGFGAWGERGVWAVWATANGDRNEAIASWLFASTVVDVVLIAAYATLLLWLAWTIRPLRYVVFALVALDLVEDVLLVIGSGFVGASDWKTVTQALDDLAGFAAVTAIVSIAKCLAVATLIVLSLAMPTSRAGIFGFFQRTGRAIWVHRLSALLLALLFALACIPSDGVLDQLPDIERQWLEPQAGGFWWALFLSILAAAAFFVLGRQRSTRIYESRVRGLPPGRPGPPEPASPPAPPTPPAAPLSWAEGQEFWWLIGPAILTLGGLAVMALSGVWGISVVTFVTFLAVPVVIVVASALLRRWTYQWKWLGPDTPSPQRAMSAWVIGDALAVGVLAVAGLGLVRSFAGPLFLDGSPLDETPGTQPGITLLFVFGAVVAVLSPLLLIVLPQRLTAAWVPRWLREALIPEARNTMTRFHLISRLGFFASGLIFLATVVLWPTAISHELGAVALLIAIVVAWVLALGSFTVLIQDRPPIRFFRLLRLQASPVLTMTITLPLVVGILFSSLAAGDRDLHAARVDETHPGAFTPVGTTELSRWLDDETRWLESDAADAAKTSDPVCLVDAGGVSVRPVILIAAEGGGIRAAYWTASVLDALGDLGRCVMLSSGVSGGSIGLTVGRVADAGTATDVVRRLAQPETLSSGVAGLLVSDVVASATGMRIPSYVDSGGAGADWKWRDRAALIEGEWIREEPRLGGGFVADPAPPTGVLVLNSTDSVSKCRVLVSQFVPAGIDDDLTPGDEVVCDRPGQFPSSVSISKIATAACLADLDWATAALFSGRFPVITPGGGLPVNGSANCASASTVQLIDGGYAEGSGLATLADLSPDLARIVVDHNRTADGTEANPFAVPVVLFAQNSVGFDVARAANGVSAEALVPIIGYGAKNQLAEKDAWIQRISGSFSQVCSAVPSGDALGDCREAVRVIRADIPEGIVRVAPQTRPTVVPPLGWALSKLTKDSLDTAIKTESTTNQTYGRFGRLDDLFDLRWQSGNG